MCPIFNWCGHTAVWSCSVQIRFLSLGMDEKRSLHRKSEHKRRIGRSHYERCCPPEVTKVKTTPGELNVLLLGELKSALKSMVGFLNTYFELLQFIEIIYITNKCNQQIICISFLKLIRLFMRNVQTAVSAHPLKTGHVFKWTYLLGMVHTNTS